jgi:hypothetical protein
MKVRRLLLIPIFIIAILTAPSFAAIVQEKQCANLYAFTDLSLPPLVVDGRGPHSSTSTAVVFTAFNVIRHKSNINLCLTAEHGPVCFILPLRSQDLYVKPLNNETD